MELGKAFQRTGKRKAATEYEEAQEAFWKNYERWEAAKAELVVRSASLSRDQWLPAL